MGAPPEKQHHPGPGLFELDAPPEQLSELEDDTPEKLLNRWLEQLKGLLELDATPEKQLENDSPELDTPPEQQLENGLQEFDKTPEKQHHLEIGLEPPAKLRKEEEEE